MISYDTIGSLIEGRFTVSAHCFAHGCGHSARLDLVDMSERLGAGFIAIGDPNPLVKLLRCQKCGGKDLGLILSPRTGYENGPFSSGPDYGVERSLGRPRVKGRRARRKVRL